MKRGGIFSKKNSLGAIENDLEEPVLCSQGLTALVKVLQKDLLETYPNLPVTGLWTACHNAAFKKKYGGPVTPELIKQITGKTCAILQNPLTGADEAAKDFELSAQAGCADPGISGGVNCPPGSSWNQNMGICVPGTGGGTDTTLPSGGGCPAGQVKAIDGKCYTIPGVNPADQCPDGSLKVAGQCIGVGGVTAGDQCRQGEYKVGGYCLPSVVIPTPATDGKCPEGYQNVAGYCVKLPPVGGGAGDNWADNLNDILGSIFGNGGGGPTIWDKIVGTISGKDPQVVAHENESGLSSGQKIAIGLMIATAAGGAAYYYRKQKQEQDFGIDEENLLPEGDFGAYEEPMEYAANRRRRRHRRHRQGRRARRICGCRR